MTAEIRFRLSTLKEDSKGLEDMLRDDGHPVWIKTANQIGMLLVGQAQSAFDDQRLGTEAWEPRYPNQKSQPYANIAGIVSDFGRGIENPPARRFQNRPAGKDTGAMRQSLTFERSVKVNGQTVVVKSDRPHSKRFQEGGKSTLLIDERVRRGVAKLLKKKPELRERLGWIFQTENIDVLETESVPRPFLGVTEESGRKIMLTVEQNLGGRPWEV